MKTPAAKRPTLILWAGIVWTITGAALIIVSFAWLDSSPAGRAVSLTAGLLAGLAIYHFGFSKLADTNLERIRSQAPGKERVCIFAFQNKRSYYMIGIMMAAGYTLRHSPIPKIYMAPAYAAIGLGLVLSSVRYYFALR
jgi:hypothetical protein